VNFVTIKNISLDFYGF